MIGETILHCKIIEKLDEFSCHLGRGGLVRRFMRHSFSEGGSLIKNCEVLIDR